MRLTECTDQFDQLELFEVGRQRVTVAFDGGNVVSDAGLLPIRELDQQLGILAGPTFGRCPLGGCLILAIHFSSRIRPSGS